MQITYLDPALNDAIQLIKKLDQGLKDALDGMCSLSQAANIFAEVKVFLNQQGK